MAGEGLVRHVEYRSIRWLMVAPRASVTEYFLSRGLLRSVFRITDPGVLRLLPPFAVSVLSMSFTGMLTYWLVVGLYQSIPFSQSPLDCKLIAPHPEPHSSHAQPQDL